MITALNNHDDLQMLRIERVLELFPVSRVHLWRMVRDGKFPAPRKLGNTSLWSATELRRWFDDPKPSKVEAPSRRRSVDDLL